MQQHKPLILGEPEKLGEGTKLAYEEIRKEVDRLYDDRIMNVDIDACARLIESNTILDAVEGTLGKLL